MEYWALLGISYTRQVDATKLKPGKSVGKTAGKHRTLIAAIKRPSTFCTPRWEIENRWLLCRLLCKKKVVWSNMLHNLFGVHETWTGPREERIVSYEARWWASWTFFLCSNSQKRWRRHDKTMDTLILKCIFSLYLVLFTANHSCTFFSGGCDLVKKNIICMYIIFIFAHIYIYIYM